ncbi:MAG: hypothetical protein ABI120_25960 [Gemmatimonadaceae bacterium]
MELIVALTVTGFMAVLGTATFTSIIDNRHILRESTAPTETASALRETIRQWLLPATIQLQAAGAPRGGSASSIRTTVNNRVSSNGADGVTAAAASGGDELTFTTTAPNPTNAPNARMRLFIDEDDQTPERGLTLEYQVNQQSPLLRRQLDSTIAGITVEYLNQQNNQWVAAVNATGIRAKAVRLTLLPADGMTVQPLMSLPMTFIVAAAASGPSATPTR